MRTRFPFRYGISSMTWVPHLLVTAELVSDGQKARGIAADGLPPKWFSKNPDTRFSSDLVEMLEVIRHAAETAVGASARPRPYTAWWRDLYDEQTRWAQQRSLPGLLAGFGTSLMERAVLDALCRSHQQPLHALLRSGELVADLGAARPELAGLAPAAFLPAQPLPTVIARHTVGLADWLTEAEVPAAERVHDGLPQSLEACVLAYGLDHFKIKLSGQLETDQERLRGIVRVLASSATENWRCTLDGNEAFSSLAAFQDYYERLRAVPALGECLGPRLLFVEQPLRRDISLAEETGAVLARWPDAPPLLLDEGDGDLAALPEALRLGYSGVSHKNCKGILKGLANAAIIWQANVGGGPPRFVSGEDLMNTAPVALTQDLAMQALLGVPHVERNGHHYTRGLSMWPEAVQEAALRAHPDLLRRHEQGFPTLDLRAGRLNLGSVNAAPFGCGLGLEWTGGLASLEDWIRDGGLAD